MRLRQLLLATLCAALPAIHSGSALCEEPDEGVIRITDQRPADYPVQPADYAMPPALRKAVSAGAQANVAPATGAWQAGQAAYGMMPAGQPSPFRPAGMTSAMPSMLTPAMTSAYGGGCAPRTGACGSGACGSSGCGNGACGNGTCGSEGCNCNSCGPGGCQSSCPGSCQSWSYASGYNHRMNCLTSGCHGSSHKCCLCNFWHQQSVGYIQRNRQTSWALFGWLVPSGCCGSGCPPTGHYNIVYAKDSGYFDQRDGRLYSAQGYGTPITVPLAPVVRHQYNYGWGIPSSRLTPISNPAGYTTVKPVHW